MKKSGCLIIIAIFIIIVLTLSSRDTLVIKDAADGHAYLALPVSEGQELTLGWRHSVELQSWEETFAARLGDYSLVLLKTRFRSYGAGVPHTSQGSYRLEDGYIVYDNLKQSYECLPFIHANYGQYWLNIGGIKYDLPELIPDNIPVVLDIEKISPLVLYGREICRELVQSWELPPVSR